MPTYVRNPVEFVRGEGTRLWDDDFNLVLERKLGDEQAKALIADGTISGGMIPKVETCIYALEQGVQGVVIIEATIGPDGRVKDAKVLRSIPLLDQAALDAVKQWTFTPTLLNGVPVPVIMTVTVNFTLQ